MTAAGMVHPISVLVVEDKPDHYRSTREAIERLGPDVDIEWAQDYETARELVIGRYFSLLIVDLVLESQVGDPDEWGGLRLIWDIVDLDIQSTRAVVVYTSHPEPDVERRALRRYGVYEFLTKKGSDELVAELTEVVEQRHHFGLKLQIVFDDDTSWEQLLRVCTRHQNQALAARMSAELGRAELEGIFRLAFSNCRTIGVHPMALGASGTGLVRVEREFEDGSRGSSVVAKFGDVELIQRELEGWKELRDYWGSERATEVLESHRGLGLGLLQYRFLGVGAQQLRTFSRYYDDAGAEDVATTLERLFKETCHLWFDGKNRVPEEKARLDLTYRRALGIDVDRLVKSYEFRFGKPCRDSDIVHHPELDRDLPHVVRMLKKDELQIVSDTWSCRTHGDMHMENLLVAPADGQCWLIDFARSGLGHWARDFAILETSIRLQLIVNSNLAELYEFESLMASAQALGAPLDLSGIADPSTRKAAFVIQRLREVAAELIEPYPPERAFDEYLVALVFASTKFLEFHRLLNRKWRKHHVLIATGVMLDRLAAARVAG
jgi:CheY-like chemotaxis protein